MIRGLSKLLGALVGLASSAVLVNGCSDDCSVSNTCGDAIADTGPMGDGGDGGGDGDVNVPPDCDAAAEPKDAPACVVDGFGVFVDATSGNDANAGTKAQPVKSIGAAIGNRAGKPRVYVCEGTYPEHVKLTAAVSIFGGFACGAWSYSGTRAKVAPTDPGYALHIDKVGDIVAIADVSFAAIAGSEAAPSSVAAFVNASPKVALRRVELIAANGAPGKSQTKAADGALMNATPTAGTLNGNSGGTVNGGLAQLCTCIGGGTSLGGAGGSINGDGSVGQMAQATPDPMIATGAGQSANDCAIAGPAAKPGSNAPNATPGLGSKKSGALTEAGWLSELGANGTAGTPGQGGGGGGGAAGGGGSGGCGGCGGSAGQGGGGGGASVALLALNSPVSLIRCLLTAADAGPGGAGGAGGDGVAGGTKGARGGAACDGGNGGKGGNGGAGGGGAGGLSVGVLYKGTKPAIDATITTGAKGGAGTGPAGNDGVDGQKADSLEVQ